MESQKKSKRSWNRSITVPIQLIVQSHKYRFVSSKFTDPANLIEKTYRGPVRTYDLDENKRLQQKITFKQILKTLRRTESGETEEKYWKQLNDYTTIQKITAFFANEKGRYMGKKDLEQLPAKYYYKIAGTTSDQTITDLINQEGFCDFPDKHELQEFSEAKMSDYYLKYSTPYKKGLRAVHWLHLFRKIDMLRDIIERTITKEIDSSDIPFLKADTEKITIKEIGPSDIAFLKAEINKNVSEISIDRNSFAYREIEDLDARPEKDEYTKTLSRKPFQLGNYTKGYRVFGHFALCCLELLTDIEKHQLPIPCANCKKPLSPDAHGNSDYCSPECHQEKRTTDRRNLRNSVPIQTKKKRKSLPKRNYN